MTSSTYRCPLLHNYVSYTKCGIQVLKFVSVDLHNRMTYKKDLTYTTGCPIVKTNLFGVDFGGRYPNFFHHHRPLIMYEVHFILNEV